MEVHAQESRCECISEFPAGLRGRAALRHARVGTIKRALRIVSELRQVLYVAMMLPLQN